MRAGATWWRALGGAMQALDVRRFWTWVRRPILQRWIVGFVAAASIAGCGDEPYSTLTIVNGGGSDVIVAVSGRVTQNSDGSSLDSPTFRIRPTAEGTYLGQTTGGEDGTGHAATMITVMTPDCHELGRVTVGEGSYVLSISASGGVTADATTPRSQVPIAPVTTDCTTP